MKQPNWLRRIFWSWTKIERFVLQNSSTNEQLLKANEALIKEKEFRVKEQLETIYELRKRIGILEETERSLKQSQETEQRLSSQQSQELQHFQKQVLELKTQLQERQHNSEKINQEINQKLATLDQIERTFFAKTGPKGKGELGERQLKVILEKAGLAADVWTENLPVGKNVVEFALKSGPHGKWIPIDSKVIDGQIDDQGKMIIDDKYKANVKRQAKEVSKYLNKKNTTSYGLLVLQSDAIYLALYDLDAHFFQQVIQESKVYITGPSLFVQQASSLAQILEIYERIHNDEEIYHKMIETLHSIQRFAKSLMKVYDNFNRAMMAHYPALTNKSNTLIKKLTKHNKVTKVQELKELALPDNDK